MNPRADSLKRETRLTKKQLTKRKSNSKSTKLEMKREKSKQIQKRFKQSFRNTRKTYTQLNLKI